MVSLRCAGCWKVQSLEQMSHSLNFLKGIICGILWGVLMGVTKRDTRSLDCSSDEVLS